MDIKGIGLWLIVWLMMGMAIDARSQITSLEVYKVFQTNCTFSSCHDNDNPILGLNLQESGPDSIMQVLQNIINVTPANFYAAGQNYKYISPGDPARSFLFRKINNGLDPTISLHEDAGDPMPQFGGALDDTEIELLRQWILGGAPVDGEVIDTTLIHDYYNNNGIASVPNPPVPPDESEGFQIHLGPFFIPPGGEKEVFLKYDPRLAEDQEITKVEVFMGDQSHHFILYKFFEEGQELCGFTNEATADDFADGYRPVDQASHTSANFQFGAQNTETVELPYNTAFFWGAGSILDLNSHYLNFSGNNVLGAEVYINVYTQPSGTAAQEMEAIMIPNLDINIPNNGQEITLTPQDIPVALCFQQGLYVWATTCHTHELGQDYDIYTVNLINSDVTHIYDGSCPEDGVPGCQTEFYDYQHPPTRIFEDYLHLSNTEAIRHEATYINNGPEDVGWGFTSEDEMMLFFFFYVRDTMGLNQTINMLPVASDDEASTIEDSLTVIPVLDNDDDPDGSLDASTVVVISGPSNGEATVNPDGSITYEPDPGFTGQDEFDYVVCDDGDPPGCDTATVTVEVSEVVGVFTDNYSDIVAYPNPTSGNLFISDREGFIEKLTLLSIHGKQLVELGTPGGQQLINIDLMNFGLADGTYLLVAEGRDGRKGVSRIVIRSAR